MPGDEIEVPKELREFMLDGLKKHSLDKKWCQETISLWEFTH